MKTSSIISLMLVPLSLSCEKPDPGSPKTEIPLMSLQEMAVMLSSLPLEKEQLYEVRDAVSASRANGYDDEYMISDLLESPGSGVGDKAKRTKASSYAKPIRDLITEYLKAVPSGPATKSSSLTLDEYLHRLSASDMQIYWPFQELWDGESMPVITFDPGGEAISNIGYEIVEGRDGVRGVREMLVTESIARERPVWVVNTNDDSAYISYEMMMRQEGASRSCTGAGTKAGDVTMLVLKEFTMNRHYDSWFRGASEFWIKCGAVSGFTASTEAELKLYIPTITDFMIVIRRSELGCPKPYDCMLISDWTDQIEDFAFMIVEDDGGTRTSWKTEANVKYQSKSYGFNVELPYNDRDDIVWRGSLSSRYLDSYKGTTGHFGDVDVVFDIR